MLSLIKALAPGFLPLIVFIVADSIWGTMVGLLVAVFSGLVEMAVSYFLEHRIDGFLLFDTGLIVALGSLSLLLRNDLFFKLKPALIEALICLLLAISLFTPHNLMLQLSKRYLRHLVLDETQQASLRRSFRHMLMIFGGHTLLVVWAALFMSRAVWAFVSGGLFYILMVAYFIGELAKRRWQRLQWRKKYRDEEWFDTVDSEGRRRGRAPRSVCHSGRGWLHPVVHLHLFNSSNQILLQQRNLSKDIQPGKWDTAVGGHVSSGEAVDAALQREAQEELGLKDVRAVPLARYVWESERESELVYVFAARLDRLPTFNPEEISAVRFWKLKKVRESLGKGIMTPNFEFELPLLMERLFGLGKKKDEEVGSP